MGKRLKKLLWVVMDFCYGLHSGVPLCCVLDFIHTSYVRGKIAGACRWEEFGLSQERFEVGYVPCRLCVARIRVGEQKPVTICRCSRRESFGCRVFHRIIEWRISRWKRHRQAQKVACAGCLP